MPQIARVEVPAAVWAKHRRGELAADDARTLTAEFEADYFGSEEENPRFAAVALAAPLLDAAARMSAAHGLRAYDAVQLASALAAQTAEPSCTALAAFGGSLRTAAAAEGFTLSPPDSWCPAPARVLVGGPGLEPGWVSPHAPQTCASTCSASRPGRVSV